MAQHYRHVLMLTEKQRDLLHRLLADSTVLPKHTKLLSEIYGQVQDSEYKAVNLLAVLLYAEGDADQTLDRHQHDEDKSRAEHAQQCLDDVDTLLRQAGWRSR